MEKFDTLDLIREKKSREYEKKVRENDTVSAPSGLDASTQTEQAHIRHLVQEHLEEKARKVSRRKWGGRGLIALGCMLLFTSCPLYAFTLIGPETVLTALAMIAGGSALLAWRPRLKDTNEAIIVAAKYGNCLTATRLALELDITLDRADRIIQELVKSGIAEIDLLHKDSTNSIVYKVRGL
jgi:hypothetical protein